MKIPSLFYAIFKKMHRQKPISAFGFGILYVAKVGII